MKSPKNLAINKRIRSLILMFIINFLFACESVDYKKLVIDYSSNTFEIIDPEEFIIDSIAIKKNGINYYLLSSKNLLGESKISLNNVDSVHYTIYLDSLNKLCDERLDKPIYGDVGVYIRRKDFAIENNIYDTKILQYFSYKFIPCSDNILDTLRAERKYR